MAKGPLPREGAFFSARRTSTQAELDGYHHARCFLRAVPRADEYFGSLTVVLRHVIIGLVNRFQ